MLAVAGTSWLMLLVQQGLRSWLLLVWEMLEVGGLLCLLFCCLDCPATRVFCIMACVSSSRQSSPCQVMLALTALCSVVCCIKFIKC